MDAVVDTWYQIIATYELTNNIIAGSCMETVAKYISWIDLRLVANERFLALLYRCMANPELREHACECFTAMVDKGMDPIAKADLIRSLNLTTLIPEITARNSDDSSLEFDLRLATLVDTMGTELIEGLTKFDIRAEYPKVSFHLH